MTVAATVFASGIASVTTGVLPATGLIPEVVWLAIASSGVVTVAGLESD